MMKDPNHFEKQHVQDVYNEIAGHFSQTRYKAWPVVEKFITELPCGSVGLDVGCGNGKNMTVRTSGICVTGLDISLSLLEICHKQGLAIVATSMLSIPWRSSSQDFVMCIAALHHLSTRARRVKAIKEMARTLVPNGKLLLYVWALEQPSKSSLYRHKLTFLSEDKQDVLVPWTSGDETGESHDRYYHLFREGELEELAIEASNLRLEYKGYDRDNWFCCFCKE